MSSQIGVVDSGVGGLSVWGELRLGLPHESLLYFADTASCPYGGRGREQIIELSRRAVSRLMDRGVKLIVVACNTMTAAAIDTLRSENPTIPFVGMEPAVKPAANHSKTGVVGILATRATLNGELYKSTKRSYAAMVKILEVAGDGLVEMVEQDRVNSPQCEELLRRYIDPMVACRADTLVLGCTHYPFLIRAIQRIYGERLMLENPAPAVARRVRDVLLERGQLEAHFHEAQYTFETSGTAHDMDMLRRMADRVVSGDYGAAT